jgi:hypothetical protein
MRPVRLVSTLCAVAILAAGIAAWVSASESEWMTYRLFNEMQGGGPRAASAPQRRTDPVGVVTWVLQCARASDRRRQSVETKEHVAIEFGVRA